MFILLGMALTIK